ncbi:hypothetical protein RIF29_15898 [Crotalaria pallida]|uniref:Uncharacterized protein n=1 Tax=Crotalaria pallida TaxID=3830 RepID=A0AAN9FED1_CROPI
MDETLVTKRPREEILMEKNDLDHEEYSKRHKPYNHILSLLESEEEESTQDLSPLITTLQQEITCASNNSTLLMFPAQENDQNSLTSCATKIEETTSSSTCFSSPNALNEEDDRERIMKHLLHASDDELGIPNTGDDGLLDFGELDGFKSGDGFPSICDELWKFEDEAANYYALMQSELFLWDQ